MNENDANVPGRPIVEHTYRIEVRVPRIAREGTTWRTLVPPLPFSQAQDAVAELWDSLALSFTKDQVRQYFADNVRAIEYVREVTRTREIPVFRTAGSTGLMSDKS